MSKIKDRYWAAYERAISMKIKSVLNRVDSSNFKDDESFRKYVTQKCYQSFKTIDCQMNSFQLVAVMLETVDFHEFPTYEVYNRYRFLCDKYDVKVIAKEEFTKFVCNYFGYTVKDKRVRRLSSKKCRVYLRGTKEH